MSDHHLKSEGWHAALASSTRRRVLELLVTAAEPLDAVAVARAISLHVTTARFHLEQLEAVGLVQREVVRVPGQRGRPRVRFRIGTVIPEIEAAGASAGARPAEPPADIQGQLSRALITVLSEDTDGGQARAIRAGENWSTTLPEETLPEASLPEATLLQETLLQEALTDPAGPPHIDSVPSGPPSPAGAVRRTGPGPYLTVLSDLGFAPELQGERVVALHACPFRDEAREHPGVVCSVHLGLLRGVARSLGQNEDDMALTPFVTPTLCRVHLPQAVGDVVGEAVAEARRE